MKCLLYKQEDLSSESQTPSRNPGVVAYTWNFSDGADTADLGLSVRLAKMVNPGLNERLCLKIR